MFNLQLLQELAKKYGNAKAIAPLIPGAGLTNSIAGTIMDKVVPAISNEIGADANAPAPGPNYPPQAPAPTPPTPPVMPPVAPKQAPAAPIAPPMAQAPAPQQLPAPQEVMPETGGYDDAARKQLYAELAKRQRSGAMFQALGGVADTISRAGGSQPTSYSKDIGEATGNNNKLLSDQFDAGRKGTREDLAAYLSQKKDTRDFGQKERELGLKHEEIKANREAASADRRFRIGEKEDQYNNSKIGQFRASIQGSDPYKTLTTLRSVRAAAEQATKSPSPYGDVQLIYAAVKAFDPNSVVREGEIKLFGGAAGIKTRLQAALSHAYSGKTLTPEQRADIISVLDNYEGTAKAVFSQHVEPTRQQMNSMGLGNRMGEIDPLLSILEGQQNAASQAAPAAKGFSDAGKEARYQAWKQQQGTR